MEERWLDIADVLECILKEDQHCRIHYLILVFSMCIAIKVTDVSAEVFHSMQNISKTSEKEIKQNSACYTDQKLKQTIHTECEKLNVLAQEIPQLHVRKV